MRRDQIIAHVARVGRGIAQAIKPWDFSQSQQKPRERPSPAIRPFAVIGIHILPKQSDFPRAE